MATRTLLTAAFGTGIAILWSQMTSAIDRDSSLVHQTISNINSSREVAYHVGHNCKPAGRVLGEMNQRKGYANVHFALECVNGKFKVHVKAHRKNWDWVSENLTLYEGNTKILELQ